VTPHAGNRLIEAVEHVQEAQAALDDLRSDATADDLYLASAMIKALTVVESLIGRYVDQAWKLSEPR
jgi:hypothetical protein